MGQELMTPAQIADICDGRDKAIALWLSLYDNYHATRDEAARLTLGGALSLSCGRDWTEDTLTRAFIQSQPIDQRDKETGARKTIDARYNFERVLTHTMDRRCWAALMEQLGFDQLLDQQARKEFHDGLRDDPVPFTPDNCAATFGNIWTNRRDRYLRGIANVFAKLDRRFRSHNGFKIGARLIIDRALNEWGSWDRYERRDTLRDVERVFLELDEKPPVSEGHSIASAPQGATPHDRWLRGDLFPRSQMDRPSPRFFRPRRNQREHRFACDPQAWLIGAGGGSCHRLSWRRLRR